MKTLLLIDGSNLLFRMFFGMPQAFRDEAGQDRRIVVGFIGALKRMVEAFKTNEVLVVFDTEHSAQLRKSVYPGYKENRIDYTQVEGEENPFLQYPSLIKALEYLGVTYVESPHYEADDYIASIIEQDNIFHRYVVISSDSDFFQLVRENVFVYNPMSKGKLLYTTEKVKEKIGVKPKDYVVFKALVGDPSDCITGIKGIGKKTASAILKEGSLVDFFKGQVDLPEKYSKKLMGQEATIDQNIWLITMMKDIPVTLQETYKIKNIDLLRQGTVALLKEAGVL